MTTQTTEDQELRALVQQSPTIARAIEAQRVEVAQEIAMGRTLAQLLQRSGPAWLEKAQPQQVAAFARVAISLGLDPLVGECYLIHGTFYVGVQGRRKRAVQTGEFDGEGTPRLPTPEECEIYGVKDGDVARIVQVWRKGVRMPGEACGIVRLAETKGSAHLPLVNDSAGMAAKRAATAAYKRVFADLDLPTADVDRSSRRISIVDVDSGRVIAEGGDRGDATAQIERPGSDFVPTNEGEQPEPGIVVDEATGEIIDDSSAPPAAPPEREHEAPAPPYRRSRPAPSDAGAATERLVP